MINCLVLYITVWALQNERKLKTKVSAMATDIKSQFLYGKLRKKANKIGIEKYEAKNFQLALYTAVLPIKY